MTTTNQQPPAEDPSQGPGPRDSGRTGRRSGAGGGSARRGSLILVVVAAVVVLVAAALGWLLTAGPLSESAAQEREIEQTLQGMSDAGSFADFNSYMCAENRVPQDLVDTITASGEQTGSDLDSMFRESIAGSFPEDLRVTGVELSGDDATATIESGADGQETEEVRMRQEDDGWKVCQSGVGMGSVPDSTPGEQPG